MLETGRGEFLAALLCGTGECNLSDLENHDLPKADFLLPIGRLKAFHLQVADTGPPAS